MVSSAIVGGDLKDRRLWPHRHAEVEEEGTLRIGAGRAPHVLEPEVDPGALLGEPDSAPDRHAELVGPLAGHQEERKRAVAGAEAERPSGGTAKVGGVLAAERHLDGVVRAVAALRQQVAVVAPP